MDSSISYIPTRRLFIRALISLIRPHRAFKEIKDNEELNYRTALIFFALAGFVFIFLHLRFVVGKWLWQLYYEPLIIIQYMIVGIWHWLLGGLVLYYLFKWVFKKEVSFKKLDIAVVYLWMSWAIMPFFDWPHQFGLPIRFLVHKQPFANMFVLHISSLITAPSRCLLVYFLLKDIGGIHNRRFLLIFLMSVLALGTRFIVEPLGAVIFWIIQNSGYPLNLWLAQFFPTLSAFIITLYWRLYLEGRIGRVVIFKKIALAHAGLILFSLFFLQFPFMKNINGSPPLPAFLEDFSVRPSLIMKKKEDSSLELSLNNKGFLYSLGPFWDGINHTQRVILELRGWKNCFLTKIIDNIEVSLELEAEDGLSKDGFPLISCRLSIEDKQGLRKSYLFLEKKNLSSRVKLSFKLDSRSLFLRELREAFMRKEIKRLWLVISSSLHSGGDYSQPDILKIRRVDFRFNYKVKLKRKKDDGGEIFAFF